jgi:hypothetical protein
MFSKSLILLVAITASLTGTLGHGKIESEV